jgi:Flp pilus assembly protein TadG
MTAAILIVMIAMFGFALDLSRSYNRKVELQSMADAAALAAARALDGSQAGIDNAVTAAANTASTFSFSYNNAIVTWSPAALTLGTSPDGGPGGWVDGATARANPGKVFFARVDTSMLAASHGQVSNLLMPVLSSTFAVTNVTAAAVAGRDSVNALPLAICANSNTPAASLSGELVEYGFRRGVSYDLMNLGPGGGAAQNFLVNPIAPAGTVGASMLGRLDIVAPYMCTGKMAIPALQGGEITVDSGFPLGSLYPHLNARFGTNGSPCQPTSAPADANVKSFDLASAGWIKAQPPGLSVGPLWSYAKAAMYSSYVASNGVEPTAGYTTYTTVNWATLYPGPPVAQAQSYPTTTPYQNTGGATAYKTVYNTRVLRVPLLRCPVPSGATVAATVVGVGKFFMTVPATSSALYAEFAGTEPWAAISGSARLYR